MKPAVLPRWRLFACAVAFVTLANASFAESKQGRGAALIQKAADLSGLQLKGSKPYSLALHLSIFEAQGKTGEGNYSETWAAPELWREEIRVPGYTETRVATANGIWQVRSLDYEPIVSNALRSAVDAVAKLNAGEDIRITRLNSTKIGQSSLECIEFERRAAKNDSLHPTTDCFDPSTGLLAKRQTKAIYQYVYSDYRRFGPKLLPGVIRVFTGNTLRMEISLVSFSWVDAPDPSLFTALAGAAQVPDCHNGVQAGKLINRVQPTYSRDARMSRHEGKTTFAAVIAQDGTLKDLELVGSAGPDLDQAATDAVRQWKYSPCRCEGKPVDVPTEITINFVLPH